MPKQSNTKNPRYSLANKKELIRISVHPFARVHFIIYTNFMPITKPTSDNTLHLDVVQLDDNLFFYKNFESVVLINDSSDVYIRKFNLSDKKIKEQAWESLYKQFLTQIPVSADMYYAIKNDIPKDIERTLFGILSIERVCSDLNIKRHNFDYQASKIVKLIEMPSFNQLITEVIHDR